LAGTDRAFGWVVDGVAAVALAAMTFHPLWFFAGAADHCNIHDPAPPNCPPCANMAAGAAFGAALVGGWLAAARAVRAGYSGTKVTS
jgi:hypothetical protein